MCTHQYLYEVMTYNVKLLFKVFNFIIVQGVAKNVTDQKSLGTDVFTVKYPVINLLLKQIFFCRFIFLSPHINY